MVFDHNDEETGETVLRCSRCGHEERYRALPDEARPASLPPGGAGRSNSTP